MKKKELKQRIEDLESEMRFLRLANRRHKRRIRELERMPCTPPPFIKHWVVPRPWRAPMTTFGRWVYLRNQQ